MKSSPTQPRKRMRRLEDRLGVCLLNRSMRHVTLTDRSVDLVREGVDVAIRFTEQIIEFLVERLGALRNG